VEDLTNKLRTFEREKLLNKRIAPTLNVSENLLTPGAIDAVKSQTGVSEHSSPKHYSKSPNLGLGDTPVPVTAWCDFRAIGDVSEPTITWTCGEIVVDHESAISLFEQYVQTPTFWNVS
jgi:hypothetical protein